MGHVFMMIAGLFEVNIIRVSLEAFTAIAFIVMLFKDTENTRQFLFVTYCIFVVLYNCLFLAACYEALSKKREFKIVCSDPQNLKRFETSSVEECTARMI